MMDWSRFGRRPDVVKMLILATTVLIMLSTSAATYQPGGTGIVWVTVMLSLMLNLFSIIVLGLGLEKLFDENKNRLVTWALIEVFVSILSAVLFFISVWICVHGAVYGSTTAFSAAGFFCCLIFLFYLYNFVLQIQIWMREMRTAQEQMTPTFETATSYGSP